MNNPTLEQLRAKLEAMGIPHDQWSSVGGHRMESPIVRRQIELITKLRDLLEEGVKQKQTEVAELHAVAQRMKHGGGI